MNGPNFHEVRQHSRNAPSRGTSLGRKARIPKPSRDRQGSHSVPTRRTPSPLAEAPISEMNTAEALAKFLVALERAGAIVITPEFRAKMKAEAAAK